MLSIPLKFSARRGVEKRLMTRAALLCLCLLATILHVAAAEPSTLYVQVIRGSDKERPAGTKWQEVGPKLSAKLSSVFRWKHYWETERQKVQFNPAKVSKVPLAANRSLEIERLKSGELEVRLICGKGQVTKTRQPAGGHMAILSGEEANKESYYVVVRSDEPVGRE